MLCLKVLVTITNIIIAISIDTLQLNKDKYDLLANSKKGMLGWSITLNKKENQLNKQIMKEKHAFLDKYFPDSSHNFDGHIFNFIEEMRTTLLYQIIKNMPKGALLHVRRPYILNADYILNITYEPHLYVCFKKDGPAFIFKDETPPDFLCKDNTWQLIKKVRENSGNVAKFDEELRMNFSLLYDYTDFSDLNTISRRLARIINIVEPMFHYLPVAERVFNDILKSCLKDNIMYVEVRSNFEDYYNLNGTLYTIEFTGKAYKKWIDSFLLQNRQFYGAKIIYEVPRMDIKSVERRLDDVEILVWNFPELIAGFDLAYQEENKMPLNFYLESLAKSKDSTKYFYADQTNWYGFSSDEDLFDAVALRARRIGHAFNLVKHPFLMREVLDRNIALEFSAISHKILSLKDLRNHQLAYFLAAEMPVILTSDDPGIWESEMLTDDFFMAFVMIAHRDAGLKLLKKLVINSLKFSVASFKSKLKMEFENSWTDFVEESCNSEWMSFNLNLTSLSNNVTLTNDNLATTDTNFDLTPNITDPDLTSNTTNLDLTSKKTNLGLDEILGTTNASLLHNVIKNATI